MPQPVDTLLRLESISADLARFKREVGYARADKCPLRSERVASDKPRAVPTSARIRRLLEAEPALLQSVCNVYIQDFLCLWYPLPPACESVPRAASTLGEAAGDGEDGGTPRAPEGGLSGGTTGTRGRARDG